MPDERAAANRPNCTGYADASRRGVIEVTLVCNAGNPSDPTEELLSQAKASSYDGAQMGGNVAAIEDVITAVESGNAERLRTLLAEDATLARARDASGVSALMHALYRQRKDMVDALRAGREDLDIFEVTSLGRPDLVAELVSRDPRLANARSGDGFTPLHFAAFFGQESAARVLLEHHADAAAVANNAMQVMPLHSAAAGRNLAIARALLEHGAPVNARQQKGWTALHAAAQHGDQPMVELLLKYGANPNAKNDDGLTPDQLAQEKGHEEIAERLRAA